MATQILAVANTAADSSDVTVTAGTPLTVALKDADGPDVPSGAKVQILLKDDGGKYFHVDYLIAPHKASLVIYGPGTYRFSRPAGVTVGVFSA